jgi:hypothetical protein
MKAYRWMEVQFRSFLTSTQNGSNGAVASNSQDAASATLSFLILENKKLRIWSGLKWNSVHTCLERETDLQNGWCHWSLCSNGVVRSMASSPLTKKKAIQIVNVHYMGDFVDSMSGFSRTVDICIKCNPYAISDPALKYEPSTSPHDFFSCTLCRAHVAWKREVLQTTKGNKSFVDHQLYQEEQKIRPVYCNAHPTPLHKNRLQHSLDQHTSASGLQETESYLLLGCHSASMPTSYSV